MSNVFWCPQHGHYFMTQRESHLAICHGREEARPSHKLPCLYNGCKSAAKDCDNFCDVHRQEFGLYMPQTYVQAYAKAKAAYEKTGDKHFVYRHKTIGHLHKGYGTARVTERNWVDAIFSEAVFPKDESLVSTHTAQTTMFAMRRENNSEFPFENL